MQRQEEKVNMREAVDAGLVVTESSGTNPDKQDTSSSSGNYTTQAVDADIRPEARKMTQDKTRIPNHRDMASTRAHCTPNACTPKLRNIYRSSPVSKCSGGMSNGEPLVPQDQKQHPVEPKNLTHKPGRQNVLGQRSSRNSNLMNMLQMMSVHISSGLVLHLDDVWTKQFKPRSSSNDVCSHQFRPRSSS
ncbi:hypothetical protein Tco_1484826 [Tanacetum coccineum]